MNLFQESLWILFIIICIKIMIKRNKKKKRQRDLESKPKELRKKDIFEEQCLRNKQFVKDSKRWRFK